MISENLLRIFRCPVSQQPLRLADDALLSRVNAAIQAGRVVNRLGETVTRPLAGGLVNEAGTLLYAIHDETPCLLADQAVELEQLTA
jgi:uncharacterized protein YbaR (Trm112 family)